jgi:hypothetical protein
MAATVYYHLLPAAELAAARSSGEHRPASYAADGFVHLSDRAETLVDTANHFYTGVKGEWYVLTLDASKLRAEVKLEPAAPVGAIASPEAAGLFPHLYGAINMDAVTSIDSMDRTPSGKFLGILWGGARRAGACAVLCADTSPQ